MIVILDTNVVISSLFFSKSLAPILAHWANGYVKLALTREIAEEYVHVVSIGMTQIISPRIFIDILSESVG